MFFAAAECPQTHPWRIVDTMTNKVLQEVTARKGHQLVLIEPKNAEVSQDLSKPSTGGGNLHFDGFDGIGGSEQLYAKAEVWALFSPVTSQFISFWWPDTCGLEDVGVGTSADPHSCALL